ncbi:uncharacterized protein J7T54_002488 [Emericellopsis cladophorae]|uniref:Uncharacterized protein n=1 Tax=Emericellopsis cladophorae TaxID=2686198 RepID=A0A9Q0BD88_9HYPO|nr:uncharacterized protein J7T54_002488 [Emericellopsis cladophorae]KAI6781132.1 hypothetical protein J7T54_002488 [Emericellopsis cladophorae]
MLACRLGRPAAAPKLSVPEWHQSANRQSQGCQKGSKLVNDVPALEDSIGQYNDGTLDALDKVLDAFDAYDNRLTHTLNYKGGHSGKVWKEWPEAIVSFNLQWSGSLSSWLDKANGKKVFLEEWGIDASKHDQASAFPSEIEDMNSAGLPSL